MHASNEFCLTHKKETEHVNGECSLCRKEKTQRELEKWKSLPLSEKLLDLHLRLQKIERGPVIFS